MSRKTKTFNTPETKLARLYMSGHITLGRFMALTNSINKPDARPLAVKAIDKKYDFHYGEKKNAEGHNSPA